MFLLHYPTVDQSRKYDSRIQMFEGPLRQPGQPLAVPCVVIHYSRERYGHREALGKLLLHSPGNDPVMQPSNKPKADRPK